MKWVYYIEIFFLNKTLKDLEDDYNKLRMVNATNGNLILYCIYIPPNDEHDKRVDELNEKLLLLKRNYHSLSLRLYGDLNIKGKNIKNKMVDKIEPFGFKVWYSKDENLFTYEQKSGNKLIKSYLD